ncbi:hypothetical protein Lser_V15G16627 [Lactuca serriola]
MVREKVRSEIMEFRFHYFMSPSISYKMISRHKSFYNQLCHHQSI